MIRARFRSTAPPSTYRGETVSLRTPSGHSLAVTATEPRGGSRGTVLLLHPMMASSRVFAARNGGRGFAQTLVDCGLRTLALDFRGHGGSGPSASEGSNWRYDDLVREDLPVLVGAVRDRWPHEPLSVVGHSLGGHVAVASLAARLAELDRLVLIASSMWLPRFEANPFVRSRKSAALALARTLVGLRGFLPARALRMGSDDEAADFVRDAIRCWHSDAWTSTSGIDYLSEMRHIAIPVLAVASAGDDYECCPDAALRFARCLPPGHLDFELVRTADDGGPAPGHMGIVTTRAAESVWSRIAGFCAGI